MSNADVSYRARPDLIVEMVDDECVVLDMDNNAYFGLNPVGRLVVEALQAGPRDLDDLVSSVVERFEVSREQARADVGAFVAELVDAGLVERQA